MNYLQIFFSLFFKIVKQFTFEMLVNKSQVIPKHNINKIGQIYHFSQTFFTSSSELFSKTKHMDPKCISQLIYSVFFCLWNVQHSKSLFLSNHRGGTKNIKRWLINFSYKHNEGVLRNKHSPLTITKVGNRNQTAAITKILRQIFLDWFSHKI